MESELLSLLHREYSQSLWAYNYERLMKELRKEIIVLHPGPINRGVEISSEVADSDQAIISRPSRKWSSYPNGNHLPP